MNDGTRAFSRRFNAQDPKRAMPNNMQAGMYSATQRLIKAVAQGADPTDGKAVVVAMKAMPTDDVIYGKSSIRADGRKLQDVYLFTTKSPAESKGKWNDYKILSTIPADKAYRPLSEGGCPMIKS